MNDKKISYNDAGVNISSSNAIVENIKTKAKKTFSKYVMNDIGSFASLIDLKKLTENYEHPVLVQSIDGVGTKTIIAAKMENFATLGHDLLSATCNDIVVMGAKPITLLDYVASSKLDVNIVNEILNGLADACYENGVALVGGETAEMPNVYVNNEYDLVGIITGVVEKKNIIDGRNISPGNIILGLSSSGLHTNGYSLARKLFFDFAKYDIDSRISGFQETLGQTLLQPHINYTKPILNLFKNNIIINGMAHITGGGFLENIPRVLPGNCAALINKNSWQVPKIFSLMEKIGNLDDNELYKTFNMGIGLVMIVDERYLNNIKESLAQYNNFETYVIGEIIYGKKDVEIR